MNITKGKIAKAQKVVIYGVEGIGKSTLASKFPDPVFVDIEGSTSNMDVARMDKPTTYLMLKNQIQYIKANPHLCKTLVIDTADWMERLIVEFICGNANKEDITQFGYGEGFIKLEQEIGRFLNLLSDLIEVGINVVLTAHAIIRKFEQPDEMGAYDRYELKLGNKTTGKTAALIKEWADMVLFCNYKTHVIATDEKGKKHKAQGGRRIIYTEHHPSWDAKNRHNLPFEIDMDYKHIAHIFAEPETVPFYSPQEEGQKFIQQQEKTIQEVKQVETQIETVKEESDKEMVNSPSVLPRELTDLMNISNVSVEQLLNAIANMGHYPKGTLAENIRPDYWPQLIAHWPQVLTKIN